MTFLRVAGAVLLALVLASTGALGQEAELRIKAAYLYRFAGFVEWPEASFAGATAPFVIGIAGADALAAELEDVLSGRTVQSRKVEVRRLRRGSPVEGLHVLFIGEAESARIGELAGALRGQPVLIVTESESATTRGSMINFVTTDNKVRFDVVLAPTEKGQLKISARLLSVARKVVGGAS